MGGKVRHAVHDMMLLGGLGMMIEGVYVLWGRGAAFLVGGALCTTVSVVLAAVTRRSDG